MKQSLFHIFLKHRSDFFKSSQQGWSLVSSVNTIEDVNRTISGYTVAFGDEDVFMVIKGNVLEREKEETTRMVPTKEVKYGEFRDE